jgi:hypothetical protein
LTVESMFGTGTCLCPSMVYFQDGENIVIHCFHLHPFVLIKGHPATFLGTVDDDLVKHYLPEELHVVCGADEMALAEISPPWKRWATGPQLTAEYIAHWASQSTIAPHHHLFAHQIRLQGHAPVLTPVEHILRRIQEISVLV